MNDTNLILFVNKKKASIPWREYLSSFGDRIVPSKGINLQVQNHLIMTYTNPYTDQCNFIFNYIYIYESKKKAGEFKGITISTIVEKLECAYTEEQIEDAIKFMCKIGFLEKKRLGLYDLTEEFRKYHRMSIVSNK